MIKKMFGLVFLVFLVSSFTIQNGHAAWPLLKERDMQQFVKTFPDMYQEYRALGLHINPHTGKISGADKLNRDKEVQRILKENGWNFMFWPKLQTITRGYSVLKYDQLHVRHGANIEKFVNDLKKAKWLTPEKKAELEAAFSGAENGLSAEAKRRRKLVHQKDFTIIRRYIPQLDVVLKEIIKVSQ